MYLSNRTFYPLDGPYPRGTTSVADSFYGPNMDILFIIMTMGYSFYCTEPVYDPFFYATETCQSEAGFSWYVAKTNHRALAFNDQYQLCNPTTSRCSDLSGIADLVAYNLTADLGINNAQRAFILRHLWSTI